MVGRTYVPWIAKEPYCDYVYEGEDIDIESGGDLATRTVMRIIDRILEDR